ncbi:MAG: hypothetical protein IKN93_03860 [Bacteroidales bacterium]|nr:hypothetical protein [Bacteroidales bacterium]
MKRISAFFPVVAALLLSCTMAGARETEIRDWEFSRDRTDWTAVTVPHSWNAMDGRSASYFRGKGYYRTAILCDDPVQPSFLRFEGAAQEAEVIVNGQIVMYHKGGYTPFVVPLGGLLHAGNNQIEVVCDNSESVERIPVSSDFNKNGGLHNPVVLMQVPSVYLDPDGFGFDRFHLVQKDVSRKRALCEFRTRVFNSTDSDVKVKVSIVLTDASGSTVKCLSKRVRVAAGAYSDVTKAFKLRRPHLWNGKKDPYLYSVNVKAGEDSACGKVGFRYYSLDREKGFFLNGEPYPLRGVAMHQDIAGKASALCKEDYDSDYAIVNEIGCNFLRLAHYPHNNYAFKLCDSLGIVVQTEIPWVNVCGTRASEAYFENIHSQMKEMVTFLYNHPSIVFWGMWNELDDWGNKENLQGPLDTRRVVDETARLYSFAKSLDPTRFTGFTDDSKFQRDNYLDLRADFYSENCYYGWYYSRNDFSGLTPVAHWIKDTMGPVNISEYGVGVNPWCHTWKSDDIRRHRDDAFHPEEYGNRFHEAHLQQIACMPFLGFTSIWVFFDFPVADRKEGYMDSSDGISYTPNPERCYMNDKGLVTRDRMVKKDAFYLYKAWWNDAETTVHIAGKRLGYRPQGKKFSIKVYSNARSLTLWQDGREIGTMTASGEISGVIWRFDNLIIQSSATTFRVVADDGTEDSITYSACL